MERCAILMITPNDGSDPFVCLTVNLDYSLQYAEENDEGLKILEECKPSDLYDRRKYWQDEFDAGRLAIL